MKHYLNVCDVNGAEVEPVDVITFGSPCQDLSVAGKRAGLKHESNGDDETTRSGLFLEAVRIIKEMRYADEFGKLQSGRANEHVRPRFAVWENVPGAFSSNKGEDFRVVLEELARVKDKEVSIPMPKNGKWQTAGEIIGDGWSVAWRTLDAQYHGVPQRRRRIFLVADFADECAGEILFECKGLLGYPSESGEEGQGIAGNSSEGIRGTGKETCIGFDGYNQDVTGNVTQTLTCQRTDVSNIPIAFVPYTLQIRSGCEGGGKGALIQTDKSACLTAAQTQTLFQPIVCLEGNGARPSHLGNVYKETYNMYTLNTAEVHAVAYAQQYIGEYKDCDCASSLKMRDYKDATDLVCEQRVCYALDRASFNQEEKNIKYIVRRLTPTECARLQGMPDEWCRLSQIEDMSDEDYEFWKQAHKIYAEINGKTYKEKTKPKMIKWYNGLQEDGSEYKAYGNGMALPCVRVPIHGIAKHGAKTMASLFDGIGGFPLSGLIDGIETLWTSEIELFPIAVTMERFREIEKYGCFTFGYEGSNANLSIERSNKEMELKMNDYQLPEQIMFNYEELKQELTEKVNVYTSLVYTDEKIKEAKEDRANLNKLKKALNDERIRREKEYMAPFNAFKAQINEIIGIIDKPIDVIDRQIKEYENVQKQAKLEEITKFFNSVEHPNWLFLYMIQSEKWTNASTSMKSIQEEINSKIDQINKDLVTLSNLPEFGFEATEAYKDTLDINKAISEAMRMAEVQKKKEEAQKAAEFVPPVIDEKFQNEAFAAAANMNQPVEEVKEEPVQRQWVSFSANLSKDDAIALKAFFESRNIEFKRI